MKRIVATIFLALACGLSGCASREVKQLAQATGTSIGLVSGKLANYQKGSSEISAKRIDLIARLDRTAARDELEIDRDLAVLKQTGQASVIELFDNLRAHAKQAAGLTAQLDAVEAQSRKDAAAVYKPLALSTGKLDQAAQSVASLGKEESTQQRVELLTSFLKDVWQEVEQRKQAAAKSQSAGDAALGNKTKELENKDLAKKEPEK